MKQDRVAADPAPGGPQEPSAAVRGYVPALDGIRAVAALVVVLFHARIGFVNGDLGVDVFFVLSGFLITGILLRSGPDGRMRYREFYRRRALRLLPAYFAVLTASVVSDRIWDAGGTLKGAAFSFFYVSNWATADGIGTGLLAHTWSLSIEEQFYLVWPLTLMGILRWAGGRRSRATGAVVALVALSYLSVLLCWWLGASVSFTWNSTVSRGLELLAGGLLALVVSWWHRPSESRRAGRAVGAAGAVSLAGLLVIANVDVADPWVEILLQWPVVTALTVTLIWACISPLDNPVKRLLATPPMVLTGRVSYGLYLWHFPVFVLIDSIVGLDGWSPRLLGLAITAIIVPLSYRYIEQPFLRLKGAPTQTPTPTLPGAAETR
jgi:peptidoglycan/LPS O-acetylase OafA/YrhL